MIKNYCEYKRPFTVIVEGNIGSGKTTFLEFFKKFDNVCVLAEPINKWRNVKGHNLLAKLYNDPKKWSFSFQSYVQLTMLQHHTHKTSCPIKLMERSIYSARYCFVEKMIEEEVLPKPSACVIDEWFDWIKTNNDISVDLIVYLRTTPEIVYERMMKRNRSEEKSIPIDYLRQLHDMHEKWLLNDNNDDPSSFNKLPRPAPVLVLDADLDKSVIENEYKKFQPHILNTIALKAQV